MSDLPPIYERLVGESNRAYEAAKLYFELGSARSLEAVGQKLGKSKALMERWSRHWHWVERAGAYDDHLAVLEAQAHQQATVVSAQEWAERRILQQEQEWQAGQKLLERAGRILAWPLALTEHITREEETPDGRRIVHVLQVFPAKWSFGDAARFAQTGAELMRLALASAKQVGALETMSSMRSAPAFEVASIEDVEAWLRAASPQQRDEWLRHYDAWVAHHEAMEAMLQTRPEP